MAVEDLFIWYQKKIGTYDKQKWETTIEHRILYGLSNIEMKNTKPNTDFIDVDLIRGSSFTKSKPKQGFMTVAQLATLRCVFLPLYSKWWTQQTSIKIYMIIFLLYVSELINVAIYYTNFSSDLINGHHNDDDATTSSENNNNVICMELVVPFLMLWVLTLIHSQISATNPGLDCSNNNTNNTNKSVSMKSRNYRSRKIMNVSSRKIATDASSADSISNVRKLPHHVSCGGGGGSISSRRKCNNKINNSSQTIDNVDDNNKNIERKTMAVNNNKNRRITFDVMKPTSIIATNRSDLELNTTINGEFDEFAINRATNNISLSSAVVPDTSSGCAAVINSSTPATNNNEPIVVAPPDIVQYLISHKRCDDWLNTVEETNSTNLLPLNNDDSRISSTEYESDENDESQRNNKDLLNTNKKPHKRHIPIINVTTTTLVDSDDDDDDDDQGGDESDDEFASYNNYRANNNNKDGVDEADEEEIGEITTSATEWLGVTTNSEDEVSDAHIDTNRDYVYDYDLTHSIFNPPSVKVSCIIWKKNEIKKAELSMLDISSAIIGKVESTSRSMDYFYFGLIISTLLSLIPAIFRLCNFTLESNTFADGQYSIFELFNTIIEKLPSSLVMLIEAAFGTTLWERIIIITACLQRLILACIFFFLLSIAEHTFKQRFLYAKLFSHLTSFRRAQQSEVPHFRLNKVRNIKIWLSVRSYLKQRGPQRSVDAIVSTAFIITLFLLAFLCVEILKESGALNSQYHVEALIWCLGLGILLLRFITLGTKINKKYRNLSVLITEQINLNLQIEQKPHKKDELTVANNVLKLAIDLIKEIQSPFKISGLSANSILYNITKLIILSALSGVLSEILGFKLKLHKIKIK